MSNTTLSLPRRALRFGLAALALTGLSACDAPSGPPRVQVLLGWDTSGMMINRGIGTFTTGSGQTVEVNRLEITTHSVEVIPCEGERRRGPPGAGPGGPGGPPPGGPPPRRMSFSLISPAWAGHPTERRPGRTAHMRVERPLLDPAQAPLDTVALPPVRFCTAHYLIGRLPATEDTPAGYSIRLHGRYRKDETDAWHPIAIETGIAHGILVTLGDKAAGSAWQMVDGDRVLVTRRLASLFADVDFATMTEAEVARAVLRQLVAETRVVRQPAKS